MRNATFWTELLGLKDTVVVDVRLEGEGPAQIVVIRVRPRTKAACRCSICGRKCPRYDRGDGVRRWRTLDVHMRRAFLEAEAPRVHCPHHGVIVAAVPWARPDAGHTLQFDDQVSWLAVHSSKSAVSQLMRVAWATVGAIITRVVADARARADPLANLRRIGIDEVSYKRGQRYITTVLDHDTGRVVWAAPGRDEYTLAKFFALLGPTRCWQIALVSADAGSWIANAVAAHCPNAKLCLDPFHVVSWATDALDDVRRQVWNDARRHGQKAVAADIKGARWALWRNAEDLSAREQAKLADIQRSNDRLYRAYLLKEQLRQVFHAPVEEALGAPGDKLNPGLIDRWLAWARRCRIEPFVQLAKSIAKHRDAIRDALRHGLSNARLESANTKVRLLTRVAFGFHSAHALVSLVLLNLGGFCPDLPGRA